MSIINIILTNLVSITLGLGGALLFYRSRSRKEGAEAYKLELDGLKDEITFLNERLKSMREETSQLIDCFVDLRKHAMELEVSLINAEKSVRIAQSSACYSSECGLRIAYKDPKGK